MQESEVVNVGHDGVEDDHTAQDQALLDPVLGEEANKLPHCRIGPEIPFSRGAHADCPHLDTPCEDTAPEDMVLIGTEGNLGIRIQRPDLLFGKLHILKGVGGLVFFYDPVRRHALVDQVLLHAGALGDDLIGSLAAGSDEGQSLAGLLLLCLCKTKGPVDPALQKRGRRTVLSDAAAKYDQEIYILIRFITSRDQVRYHGSQQHALKIEIDGSKEVA